MLPLPVQSSPRFPVRALLGHCFYRRVILWAVTVIFFLCLVLFSGGVHTRHGRILDHLAGFAKADHYKSSSGSQYEFEGSRVGHNGIDSTDYSASAKEMTSNVGDYEKTEQYPAEQQTTYEPPSSDPVVDGPHWLKYKQ